MQTEAGFSSKDHRYLEQGRYHREGISENHPHDVGTDREKRRSLYYSESAGRKCRVAQYEKMLESVRKEAEVAKDQAR